MDADTRAWIAEMCRNCDDEHDRHGIFGCEADWCECRLCECEVCIP